LDLLSAESGHWAGRPLALNLVLACGCAPPSLPPMTQPEEPPARRRPIIPPGARIWLWGLLCFVVGGAIVSRFHGVDTALAVASGLLIGATVNTFIAWKRKRESLVWAMMAAVALVWIIALRIIEHT
jgi:hypothetical protein